MIMFLGRLDSKGYLHPRVKGFSSGPLKVFFGPEYDFVGLTRGEFHFLFLGSLLISPYGFTTYRGS